MLKDILDGVGWSTAFQIALVAFLAGIYRGARYVARAFRREETLPTRVPLNGRRADYWGIHSGRRAGYWIMVYRIVQR